MSIFVKMVAASIVGMLIFNAGDDLEAALFPVGRVRSVKVISRNDFTTCWVLVFERLREALPQSLAWIVVDASRPRQITFISPYDPTQNRMVLTNEDTLSGTVDTRKRCFDLPPPMQGADKTLIFRASVRYEVWHHLWLVPLTLGPFVVPPMPKDDPALK